MQLGVSLDSWGRLPHSCRSHPWAIWSCCSTFCGWRWRCRRSGCGSGCEPAPATRSGSAVIALSCFLDPNIRTAKVRIEVPNLGVMRVVMFVIATFYGKQAETHAAIPATAILYLHDRPWVYAPVSPGHFKCQEVVTGITLPGNMQEIVSGLKPGDQVIVNALPPQNTVEQ